MAMLNFKQGLYKNLPKSINNGTIYVTTDEKAMYVDLNDSRIRLSQIITCTLAEWQALTPPYSSDAFYYIIDKNALLKYNEAKTNLDPAHDEGYTEGWVQINSTKSLSDAIDALGVRMTAVEGKANANATAITNLGSRVGDLEAVDQTHAGQIADLTTHLNGALGKIGDLGKVIGYIGSGETLPEVANENDVFLHNGVLKIYKNATWVDYSDLVQEIEGLKVEFENLKNSTATDEGMKALQEKVTALEEWVATANTTLAGLRTDVDAAKKAADDAQDAVDKAQGDVDTLAGEVRHETTGLAAAHTAAANAKQAADDAQGTANQAVTDAANAKKAADEANANAETRLLKSEFETFKTTNSEEIAAAKKAGDDAAVAAKNAQDTADGAAAAAKTADDKAVAAQGTADQAKADAKTADEKAVAAGNAASAAQGTADEAKTAAETNATAIGNLRSDLSDEVSAREEAIEALEADLLSRLQTADAMKFEGVVAAYSDLPAIAEKGATYKVTEEFVIGEDDNAKLVHIGDLLIASGTEVDGVEVEIDGETVILNGVITDIDWQHVPSGYVADYNPEMAVTVSDNIAQIKLTSGVNKDDENAANDGDLGIISIEADANSSLTITTNESGNVVMSMVWGSFGEEEA